MSPKLEELLQFPEGPRLVNSALQVRLAKHLKGTDDDFIRRAITETPTDEVSGMFGIEYFPHYNGEEQPLEDEDDGLMPTLMYTATEIPDAPIKELRQGTHEPIIPPLNSSLHAHISHLTQTHDVNMYRGLVFLPKIEDQHMEFHVAPSVDLVRDARYDQTTDLILDGTLFETQQRVQGSGPVYIPTVDADDQPEQRYLRVSPSSDGSSSRLTCVTKALAPIAIPGEMGRIESLIREVSAQMSPDMPQQTAAVYDLRFVIIDDDNVGTPAKVTLGAVNEY